MQKLIKNPLVSVIMPVYNGSFFVTEAIESILAQTYKPLEFIIVDDCSRDSTPGILEQYKKRFPEALRVISLKKNLGGAGSAAVNAVLHKAKGKFIARMDSDDIAHPQKIELQVKYMLAHPEVIVLGTQADVINGENEIVGKKNFPLTHKKIYESFAVVNPMLHPSCMFRRALLPSKDKLYENKFEPNDDYYTFFKFLNYGKFANLPQPLFYYRVHGNNISLQNPKSKFQNSLMIRKLAINTLGYVPTNRGKILTFAQRVLISILPEKIIVPLYMLFRGMLSPINLLPRTKISLPTFTSEKVLVYEA
ncbi:glycosyltransferase [Candidatus Microgenomates bacterium]|nr:glycosyltransferase [Candidatus Microgenomates bacterium]